MHTLVHATPVYMQHLCTCNTFHLPGERLCFNTRANPYTCAPVDATPPYMQHIFVSQSKFFLIQMQRNIIFVANDKKVCIFEQKVTTVYQYFTLNYIAAAIDSTVAKMLHSVILQSKCNKKFTYNTHKYRTMGTGNTRIHATDFLGPHVLHIWRLSCSNNFCVQ